MQRLYCNLLLSLTRDKFTRAQKRKSGAFRSAAVIMNELQRNIDGWEVIAMLQLKFDTQGSVWLGYLKSSAAAQN